MENEEVLIKHCEITKDCQTAFMRGGEVISSFELDADEEIHPRHESLGKCAYCGSEEKCNCNSKMVCINVRKGEQSAELCVSTPVEAMEIINSLFDAAEENLDLVKELTSRKQDLVKRGILLKYNNRG